MKKEMARVRMISISAATAFTLLVLAACTNPVLDTLKSMAEPSYGLVGTWVNGSVGYVTNNGPGSCYRLSIRNDGTFTAIDSGLTMSSSGTYSVANVTASGTSRTYSIDFLFSGFPATHQYLLAKITGGNSWESVFSGSSFPTTISPGANYWTYALQ